MKKIIMLIIATMLIATHDSFAARYTIPGKTPTEIDLEETPDFETFESFSAIAKKDKKLGLPFVMAVAFANNNPKKPYYYGARSILALDRKKTGQYIKMEDLTSIYFFVLNSPTDAEFRYICSGTDLFVNKDPRFTQLFDAFRTTTTSYTIPGKPSTEIDLTEIPDSVTFDHFADIAQKDQKLGLPFIMAVAFANNNPRPYYYGARSILAKNKEKTGPFIKSPLEEDLTSIYFFVLDKPTDAQFKYLCSGIDPKYNQLFKAYEKKDRASFNESLRALSSPKPSFSTPTFFNISTKEITVQIGNSIAVLRPKQSLPPTFTEADNLNITITCPGFQPITTDMRSFRGTPYIALDAGIFLFGNKIPQAPKIGLKSITRPPFN